MTQAKDAEAPAIVPCPHCGKPVPWTDVSPWKPFCSKRCRLIDLGDWLTERNAIPGESEPVPRADDEE